MYKNGCLLLLYRDISFLFREKTSNRFISILSKYFCDFCHCVASGCGVFVSEHLVNFNSNLSKNAVRKRLLSVDSIRTNK